MYVEIFMIQKHAGYACILDKPSHGYMLNERSSQGGPDLLFRTVTALSGGTHYCSYKILMMHAHYPRIERFFALLFLKFC